MEKFDELLEQLKALKLIQTKMDWAENIPQDIWDKYIDDKFETVSEDLNVDRHRHYETSITVIKIYDRLLGITHISNIYSEGNECEDCYVEMQFSEMIAIPTVAYTRK